MKLLFINFLQALRHIKRNRLQSCLIVGILSFAMAAFVFSAAGKADALTGTGFNKGSYVPAEFNAGALPELGAAQTVVTGIEKAVASAPTFTGDKFGATFAGSQVAISASFAGTEGTVNVSGNYDKATSAASAFVGTEATISHEVTTGSKSVTVQ